jgi:hypothetical protein
MKFQNWIVRTNKTKYPDLYTYTILEENPDHYKGGANNPDYFSVASELDSKENAYLISASHDMYTVINKTIESIENAINEQGVHFHANLLPELKNAIAKAEGKC